MHQSNLSTSSKFSAAVLALFTLLKLVLAYWIPLFGDETYYWFWGKNLQLSYFDHPPFVAWMTSFSEMLIQFFPHIHSAFLLRLPFVILSSLTVYILLLCYRKNSFWLRGKQIDEKFFLLFIMLNPLIGLGGLIVTPDAPMMFFWAISYLLILNLIETPKASLYALLGVSLGLGFCSKYHMVLFVPFVLIALFVEKRFYQIHWKKLSLTVLTGLISSLPVLIWNYQNDWASFKFQLNHGFSDKDFNLSRTLAYIGGQILILNPILSFAYLFKARSNLSTKIASTQWLFFLYSSFKSTVEANWPMTAHAQAIVGMNNISKKIQKLSLVNMLFFWVLFAFFFNSDFGQAKFDKLPQSIAAKDLYLKTKGYRPLYGPTYQMSSLLSFVSGENIPKLKEFSRFDFYDQINTAIPTENEFYVLKYNSTNWPEWMTAAPNTKGYLISEVHSFDLYQIKLYKIQKE